MQETEQPAGSSDRWTYGIAAAVVLLVGAYALNSFWQGRSAPPEDPKLQVERRAGERMAGVRCIGAKASSHDKQEIARLLAVTIVSPHGVLPSWLPASYGEPTTGRSGADTWQALAADCPDAPAFGTPFGFPSADIEKELRKDPEFASLSDQQWTGIKRLEAKSAPKAGTGS